MHIDTLLTTCTDPRSSDHRFSCLTSLLGLFKNDRSSQSRYHSSNNVVRSMHNSFKLLSNRNVHAGAVGSRERVKGGEGGVGEQINQSNTVQFE